MLWRVVWALNRKHLHSPITVQVAHGRHVFWGPYRVIFFLLKRFFPYNNSFFSICLFFVSCNFQTLHVSVETVLAFEKLLSKQSTMTCGPVDIYCFRPSAGFFSPRERSIYVFSHPKGHNIGRLVVGVFCKVVWTGLDEVEWCGRKSRKKIVFPRHNDAVSISVSVTV